MSAAFLIASMVFTVGLVIVLRVLPTRMKKVSISLVATIIFITIVVISVYLLNPSFARNVNIIFNAENHHRCVVNNQSFYLPLPSNTILSYRTSDTHAIYLSKASLDEILDFYQLIEESIVFSKKNDESLKLSFRYSNINFIVIAEDKDDIRKIIITTQERINSLGTGQFLLHFSCLRCMQKGTCLILHISID